MGSTWFTADTHFGHARIIGSCNRPFVDAAEMDAEIIRRWNQVVGAADTVWVLGDWALGDKARGLEIVSELHGTKHLVAGNHDACWPGRIGAQRHLQHFIDAGFASVEAFARVKLPVTVKNASGRKVLLSHFPYAGDSPGGDRYAQFRLCDQGAWLLHGHVHNSFVVSGRGINVGVDMHDFAPVGALALARMIDSIEDDGAPGTA
ncbi:metallophosphoesterase family protein [Arthrobacter sp. AQ5-05]|uniref:metallophosphoesterase family protein n=1 Tax=Arthrobacter sp. AQ5-05 TaxID=2184581 RepID=UPI0015ECA2CE|nr:metallophosphoesterase family protein [Arthrobacter sp. AQ5-05]